MTKELERSSAHSTGMHLVLYDYSQSGCGLRGPAASLYVNKFTVCQGTPVAYFLL